MEVEYGGRDKVKLMGRERAMERCKGFKDSIHFRYSGSFLELHEQ